MEYRGLPKWIRAVGLVPVTFTVMVLSCWLLVGAALPGKMVICVRTLDPGALELAPDGACTSYSEDARQSTVAAGIGDSSCGECLDTVLVPAPDSRRPASTRRESRVDNSASQSPAVSSASPLGHAALDRFRNTASPTVRSSVALLSSVVLIA